MVGSSAYNADVKAIAFVPAGETVDDVDSTTGIEVVDGPFSVDEPDLMRRLATD
jgi:hypothetical protein